MEFSLIEFALEYTLKATNREGQWLRSRMIKSEEKRSVKSGEESE